MQEEVIYLPNKVQSEIKKGTVQISNSFPLYESIFALFLQDPSLVQYFQELENNERIVEFKKTNRDEMGELMININNMFQNLHFSDQGETIRIRNIVERLKNSLDLERNIGGEVDEIEPEAEEVETVEIRNKILNAISGIFDIFRRVTFKKGEINLTNLKNHDDMDLKVKKGDKKRFDTIEKLTDKYFAAIEKLMILEADDIKGFLESEIGRYDPYYSVQELIIYLLRSIYKIDLKIKEITDKPTIPISACVKFLSGIPIFSLTDGQKNVIMDWYQKRNWPSKMEFDYYDEKHKRTIKVGYILFRWVKDTVEILRMINEMEKSNNIHKTTIKKNELNYEVKTSIIDWALIPFINKSSFSIIKINSLYPNYNEKVTIDEFICEAFNQEYEHFEKTFLREFIDPSLFIIDARGEFLDMIKFPEEFEIKGEDYNSEDFEFITFNQKYQLFGYVIVDEVDGGDVLVRSSNGNFESVCDREQRDVDFQRVQSVIYKRAEINED